MLLIESMESFCLGTGAMAVIAVLLALGGIILKIYASVLRFRNMPRIRGWILGQRLKH